MPLPNFLCLGAQKAGTTTLWRLLKQHPEVHVPLSGELHFFNTGKYETHDLDWYRDEVSKGYRNQTALGDISPGYMSVQRAAARIYSDLGPDVKLIFLLRNPAARAYSAYMSDVASGRITMPFEDALIAESKGDINMEYLIKGHYARHISRFIKIFPMQNIKIFKFEETIKNQYKFISDVSEYIGVNPPVRHTSVHANKGGVLRFPGTKFLFSSNPLIKSIKEKLSKYPYVQNVLRALLRKEKPEIDNSLLTYINIKYFKNDILKLKGIVDFGINDWLE